MQIYRSAQAILALSLLWSPWTGHAQETARIKLSAGIIDAGATLDADIDLDNPAPCSTAIGLYFVMQDNQSEQFALRGNVEKGQRKAHLSSQVGLDRAPGVYRSLQFQMFPCPGYEKLTVIQAPAIEVVSLTVRAIKDTIVFPSTAGVALSLTQTQFFDTKVGDLNKLKQQVTTRIERNSADLPELRQFLVQVVDAAISDLNKTESQYRETMHTAKDAPLPPLFADFRHRYEVLRVQLRAPIQGVAHADLPHPARLVYVQQLKTRADESPSMAPQNATGVYPAVVTALLSVMTRNIGAYNTIKSGRVGTYVRITSHPTGAHIQYKYSYDPPTDYKDFSSLTDVQRTKLELVSYTFKFHKEGCNDEPVIELDPYDDPDPSVDVEFQDCRHR